MGVVASGPPRRWTGGQRERGTLLMTSSSARQRSTQLYDVVRCCLAGTSARPAYAAPDLSAAAIRHTRGPSLADVFNL